ncbi:MAG: diguanylate cyclase [Rhodospirillales bacterium]|nr:diguanylate cyclase [Thalassospira sp.]MBR9782002.1 diguanylate cyclase [Rhodospirillales bacterium]MBR9818227.1 diguanylate cyclase [Rhodospirillales bacterium]MCD1596108.1 diguanylate cyclase [Thalassospira xiamenensis]QPL38102.1 diguanylate cyclase [Thalassospira sp. B30-1]
MGAGDGRYPSNPYAAYTYGRSVRKKGAPDPDQHQVDIVNRDILNAEPAVTANIHDIADVLGIPDEQVTPAVERAISRLMLRVNGLSDHLSELQRHQVELARAEGRDPFTGALSRTSFMQIVENEMVLVGSDRTTRALLLCEIANLDDVLQRHGHGCKEGVFTFLYRTITEFIMPPHQVGYLGCNDFIALLYNMDEQDAWQRADAITRRLRKHPYFWNGKYITIVPVFGIYHVKSGETAEEALVSVDYALRAEKEMKSAQLQRIPSGL